MLMWFRIEEWNGREWERKSEWEQKSEWESRVKDFIGI